MQPSNFNYKKVTSLKRKAVKGIAWSAFERFSAQGVQFILGIILARLLLPEDYGLIGMLAIFLAISDTFIQSGFGIALIQKKNRDELDFSTTLYFNVVVAVLSYVILFFTAPLIAKFYNQEILISLTRAFGIVLIINSLAVVQRTKYTIDLDFKTQTKASISSIVVSGGLGIYMAYSGFGVWSLVAQALTRAAINTVVLWLYSKWLPKEGFSFERFKKLFSFSSKILASALLNTVYRNVYLIIIGKIFSIGELGFYTRAQQFSDFPSSNMTGIFDRVTFPILSKFQDDDTKLKDNYRKLIKLSALLIFPLMMGLAALAEPLIQLLLTEKWMGTVWMLQLLCFAGMWYPIHSLNLSILNVKGRSDLFLKLEVVKKLMITIVIVISVPFGIKAMILGQIATSYLALVINTYYTKKIIDYGFWQQMVDLFKVLILSFGMGALIYITIGLIDTNIGKLLVGFVEGAIFYLGLAWLFNIGEIRLLPSLIKRN